ncbi:NAD-dependent epimerase/dehydratase family protein [Emcibacteraceae bacterium]|nr:NAD-dependent epimerase/dehydratase family protein [Emcibacteraceae bacterium]
MSEKIAIIGGSGFIGTVLTKQLLEQGFNVVNGDKNTSQKFPEHHILCDVRDQNSLNSVIKGADVVVNLAAEHRDDVSPISLYYDVNVDGAKNICDVADRHGVKKIIFTSSVAIYGFAKGASNEETPINPFNDYGQSKADAETVYEEWLANKEGRQLQVIRPSVVFGKGNRGNVYNLLKQVSSGKFLMIGNGLNHKSMSYVENIAGFIKFQVELDEHHGIYNYADMPDFDVNTLVCHIRKSMGKSATIGFRLPHWLGMAAGMTFDVLAFISRRTFPISKIRVDKFCADTMVNANKAHNSGYKPTIDFAEGLEKTIKYEFLK